MAGRLWRRLVLVSREYVHLLKHRSVGALFCTSVFFCGAPVSLPHAVKPSAGSLGPPDSVSAPSLRHNARDFPSGYFQTPVQPSPWRRLSVGGAPHTASESSLERWPDCRMSGYRGWRTMSVRSLVNYGCRQSRVSVENLFAFLDNTGKKCSD